MANLPRSLVFPEDLFNLSHKHLTIEPLLGRAELFFKLLPEQLLVLTKNLES